MIASTAPARNRDDVADPLRVSSAGFYEGGEDRWTNQHPRVNGIDQKHLAQLKTRSIRVLSRAEGAG
mgnify:CR=1 FL=1